MGKLDQFVSTVGGLSGGALVAIVILAGFALSGYAIYAVLAATRRR